MAPAPPRVPAAIRVMSAGELDGTATVPRVYSPPISPKTAKRSPIFTDAPNDAPPPGVCDVSSEVRGVRISLMPGTMNPVGMLLMSSDVTTSFVDVHPIEKRGATYR